MRHLVILRALREGRVEEAIRGIEEVDLEFSAGAMELDQPTLSSSEPRFRDAAKRELRNYLADHPSAAIGTELRRSLQASTAPAEPR